MMIYVMCHTCHLSDSVCHFRDTILPTHIWGSSLHNLHLCTLVTYEDGQVMYVAMPYFVFMDAMVSCLTHGENTFLV